MSQRLVVNHRGVAYAGAPYPYVPVPCNQWLVDHYTEAVAPEYFDALKALKASFKGYQYNSATDDNVVNADGTPHADGLRVKACAEALGVPAESMYLHWAVDTWVTFWISSVGPEPFFYPAGSRVEMYRAAHQSGGRKRELCSFLPAARPAQTMAMLQVAETPSRGIKAPNGVDWIAPPRTYDGLFLDNCGNVVYNWGSPLVSGGIVQECGLTMGSAAFNAWYWGNLRDWLVEFRTAMRRLSQPQLVAINCSNSWTDDFCTFPVADRLVQEFVGNPIRDSWPPVLEAARRHLLASQNGVGIWLSCNPALGTPAESWAEMQYAALCFHLVVQREGSSTHVQDWTGPYGTVAPDTYNWPAHVVSPVESNPQFGLLGAPTGDPYRKSAQGAKTPLGTPYELIARPYTKGEVVVRQMAPYNGKTDDVVEIDRGPQVIWIQPDGTNNTTVAKIPIKNGGGAILVVA